MTHGTVGTIFGYLRYPLIFYYYVCNINYFVFAEIECLVYNSNRTCGSVVMWSHGLFVLTLVQIKFLLSGEISVDRLKGGEGEEKPVQLFTNSLLH